MLPVNWLAVFQRDGLAEGTSKCRCSPAPGPRYHDMQHGGSHHARFAVRTMHRMAMSSAPLAGSVNTQRCQHRHQNVIVYLVVVMAHTQITGGDTDQLRQRNERTGQTLLTLGNLTHSPSLTPFDCATPIRKCHDSAKLCTFYPHIVRCERSQWWTGGDCRPNLRGKTQQ